MSFLEIDQKILIQQSKTWLQRTNEKYTLDEYETLRNLIRYHEWRYAVKDSPVISDYEYDQLYKILEKIEMTHPDWMTVDSPTQRVTSDLTEDKDAVPHLSPMLSLANSYNEDDLFDFDKQIKKLLAKGLEAKSQNVPTTIEYVVEPKFDGGSVALVYDNDYLERAATRGNGVKGEFITPNIKTMKSIPLRASFSEYKIKVAELRGEALIRKDIFEQVNTKRAKAGQTLFANPRNAATGGLRTKDPNETARRKIDAFIYQIGYLETNGNSEKWPIDTHFDGIKLLGDLGFKIPSTEMKLCKSIEEVINFCKMWEAKREGYPYEIDGMVVKVNNLAFQELCGFTAHHPRWAIAFKFKAKQATTKLLEVEYQVGKIGTITPVAKVEPVQLAGVTVSSISLHNQDFIDSKDIRIGDSLIIERAGDVIPYIVKSIWDVRDGSEKAIVFPKACPSCKTEVVREEDEAAWRCPNYLCEAQVLQRMSHFVSKHAMDIDGFGASYIERFYAMGWLQNIDDIFNLDYNAIAELEGFGEKSAANLKSAIDTAKGNPISRLLHGLSIHHLGTKASKLIAGQVAHLLDLEQWKEDDYIAINEIGPTVAENMIEYFGKEENVALLQRMESLGVNLSQTEEDKPKGKIEGAIFSDKTILFTGTLTNMTRKEAQTMAEEHGAKNISAVSSKLNYLVVGEKAGSKLKKAKALGTVTVLTEKEFQELINK